MVDGLQKKLLEFGSNADHVTLEIQLAYGYGLGGHVLPGVCLIVTMTSAALAEAGYTLYCVSASCTAARGVRQSRQWSRCLCSVIN